MAESARPHARDTQVARKGRLGEIAGRDGFRTGAGTFGESEQVPDAADLTRAPHMVQVVDTDLRQGKPSNGFEPLTPSLPWMCSTN